MLNNPHYSEAAIPSVSSASITAAKELIDVSFAGPVVRRDATTDPATPIELITDRTLNGNIERILVKLTKTLSPASASVPAEKPFTVQAHLVISYDKRYATRAQVGSVVTGLLNHLCYAETEGGTRNAIRYVNGEL